MVPIEQLQRFITPVGESPKWTTISDALTCCCKNKKLIKIH